eukprot:5041820-Amphidinium_carterae.1
MPVGTTGPMPRVSSDTSAPELAKCSSPTLGVSAWFFTKVCRGRKRAFVKLEKVWCFIGRAPYDTLACVIGFKSSPIEWAYAALRHSYDEPA